MSDRVVQTSEEYDEIVAILEERYPDDDDGMDYTEYVVLADDGPACIQRAFWLGHNNEVFKKAASAV